MSDAVVTVECMGCKKTRDIGPGKIAADDVPMCDSCYMPMVAVKAKRKPTDRR